MKRDYTKIISDIVFSVGRVEKLTKDLSFEDFEKDLDTQDIVLRRISVIGEAANNLPTDFRKKHTEVNWHDIIGMRNVVVHEYFDVDLDIVWQTLKEDLPKLKREMLKMLKNKA